MKFHENWIGLVAAAGASSRMGCHKGLLKFDADRTFVEVLIQSFNNAQLSEVVLSLPDAPLDQALKIKTSGHGVVFIHNPEPDFGLSGSIRAVLARYPKADGIIFTPIDAPFVSSALIRKLVETLSGENGIHWAAVPTHQNRQGHPVAFSKESFEKLKNAAELGGPRHVLKELGNKVAYISWPDENILANINTLDEYQAHFPNGA